MVPLTQVPPGQRVRLVSITGGRQMARRLLALGLSVGSELQVLHHRGHGVVVARDGNRVALGGGVAEHLMTEILS
jgi:ferrous iron transport protein A